MVVLIRGVPRENRVSVGTEAYHIIGERKIMTRELKWRIVTLQIVLVVLLAGVSGLLFAAANYDHSTVTSELSAQQIVFPAADSASVKSLPAADAAAMAQYA